MAKKILPDDEAHRLSEDPSTTASTLSHIVQTHQEHPHIIQAIAKHPNADAKTLDYAFKTDMADSALDHPNVSPTTVDFAYKKLVHGKPVADLNDTEHGPIIMNPKLSSVNREYTISRMLDEPNLDYDQGSILSNYFNSNLASPDMVYKGMAHKNRGIKMRALVSPMITDHHVSNAVVDNILSYNDAKDLIENEHISPDSISLLYSKYHDKAPENNSWYHDSVEKGVVGNPNSPTDLLKKIYALPDHGNVRPGILSHHNYPLADVLREMKSNPDRDVMSALVDRKDTPENVLRDMDKRAGDTIDKWGWSNDMLQHPNYPEDLQIKRAMSGAHAAYAVLKRPEVSEVVMRALVNHKNANVVEEALKHKSITPAAVTEAYNRKSKAISTLASKHHMLPADLKMKSILTNPESAAHAAKTSDDPIVLKQVLDSYPKSELIHQALMSNNNVDSSTLDRLVDTRHAYPDDEGKKWNSDIVDNPNLSKESAKKIAKDHGGAHFLIGGKYPFNDKELMDILDDHMRRGGHEQVQGMATHALTHPGSSPKLLSEILMGRYGKPDRHLESRHFKDHVAANPEVFNKEVVDAALSTPYELASNGIVGDIAAVTPHLSSQEIDTFLERSKIAESGGDRRHSEYMADIAGRMMHNDNTNPETRDKVINANLANNNWYRGIAQEAALSSKFPIEKVAHYLTMNLPKTFGPGSAGDALIDRIKKADDPEIKWSVLENTPDPKVVRKILEHEYGPGISSEKDFIHAIKNPHPEVVNDLLNWDRLNFSLHNKRSSWYGESKKAALQAVDDLASHEDQGVISNAFKLMSPQGQEKVLRGRSMAETPELIPGLSEEALKNVKVDPGMSQEVVDEIVKHPKVRWEHLYDAVDHSEISATKVRRKAQTVYEEKPNAANRESLRHIDDKILDKYPDSAVALTIARNTKDPRIMNKIMEDSKLKDLRESMLSNDNALSKHIDSFIGIAGPANKDLAEAIAQHEKASPKMLAHIAKTYPELMDVVASNSKSTSSKVYPHIINSKNETALKILINQPDLPQDVREEIGKDPNLYLSLKPSQLVADHVSEIAHGDDQRLVSRALSKGVMTPEQVDSAVKSAVNKFKGEDLENIFENAIFGNHQLSHGTQRLIADKSPSSATMVNLITGESSVPDDLLSRALDMYDDPSMVERVSNYMLYDSDKLNGVGDDVISKFLGKIDLDKKYGSRAGSYTGAGIINQTIGWLNEEKSKKVDYGSILDKVEKIHGKTLSSYVPYSTLLGTLANKADESAIKRLAVYPATHLDLLGNSNLTKDMYDHIVDAMPATMESYKEDLGEYFSGLIDNKFSSPESLQKVYDLLTDKELVDKQGPIMDKIASNPRLSDDLFKKLFKENVAGALSQGRIGEQGVRDKTEELASNLSGVNDRKIENLMKNPHFRMKAFISDAEHHGNYAPRIAEHIVDFLGQKINASEEDLGSIVDWYTDVHAEFPSEKLVKMVVENYNTSPGSIEKLRIKGVVPDEILYHNPKMGGAIWRAKDHPFPERISGLEHGKELNAAVFTPHLEKVKAAAAKVPPGGYLDWAQFKIDNPSMAGNPAVRQMFVSAPKQRLTEDHAQEYIKGMPSKHFHVSYTMWTGMQRHNKAKQLVVQINNGTPQDDLMNNDPGTFKLYKLIQKASYYSSHPVNPQSIAWARVDTSNKEHWFIDEVQSDLNAGISREMAKIKEKEGAEDKLNEKFGLTVQSADKALNKLLENIHGWDQALLENVMRTAQMHGVKKVSIHSGKSKTLVNKGEDSEVTRKYDKLYNVLPQELGFKADKYRNIPSAGDGELNGKNSPVWTIEIPSTTKKSEETIAGLSKSSLKDIIKAVKNLTNNGGTLTSMKEHSPETYQAAMDNIKALASVLKEAGFHIGQQGPPAEEPAKLTPTAAAPEVPKASADKPITHGQLVYGPGAVREYGGSDVRQKDPSGEWKHVSMQGDEGSKS